MTGRLLLSDLLPLLLSTLSKIGSQSCRSLSRLFTSTSLKHPYSWFICHANEAHNPIADALPEADERRMQPPQCQDAPDFSSRLRIPLQIFTQQSLCMKCPFPLHVVRDNVLFSGAELQCQLKDRSKDACLDAGNPLPLGEDQQPQKISL